MGAFKLVAISDFRLYQSCHKASSIENYMEYLAKLLSGKLFSDGSAVCGSDFRDPVSDGQWKKPDILILREKGMEESLYVELFKGVWEKSMAFSDSGERPMIIPHTHLLAAEQTGGASIHLPFSLLQEYHGTGRLAGMEEIGVSIHSAEEAVMAQGLGAAYLTAGHIFATDCKPGLLPRGISFLERVCGCVSIPVYAIGGIHRDNLFLVRQAKAAGACMMSGYMCQK